MRKAIMRRVYVVFWTRQLMKPGTRLAAASAIVLAIASTVSVPHIVANALHSSNVFGYSLIAVAHTTLFVQLGMLATSLILLWTLFDALMPRMHLNAHA